MTTHLKANQATGPRNFQNVGGSKPHLIHQQHILRLSPEAMVIIGNGLLFRHVDPNDAMWDGEGERTFKAFVPFVQTLTRTPVVTINISGIDASHAQNLRIKVSAEGVRKDGFFATAFTWGDTKIASIDVAWTAFHQNAESRATQLSPVLNPRKNL